MSSSVLKCIYLIIKLNTVFIVTVVTLIMDKRSIVFGLKDVICLATCMKLTLIWNAIFILIRLLSLSLQIKGQPTQKSQLVQLTNKVRGEEELKKDSI